MRFKAEQKKQGQNAQPGYSKLLPRLNISDLKNFKNYLAVKIKNIHFVKIKSRGSGKNQIKKPANLVQALIF